MDWRTASSARRRAVVALVLALTALGTWTEPTLAAPDTCTWTGAVDNRWSVAGNWTGCDSGNLPEAGDALVFPPSASNKSMSNDILRLAYASLTFHGTGGSWGVASPLFPMDPGDVRLTNGAQVFVEQQLVLTASRTFSVEEGSTLEVTAENIVRLSGPGVRLTLDCVHVEFPPGTDFPAIRLFA